MHVVNPRSWLRGKRVTLKGVASHVWRPNSVPLSALLMATILSGCGGGGGGGGDVPAPPPSVVTPIAVKATSYENAKEFNTAPIRFPIEANTTRAVADFHQKGQMSLFLATMNYDPSQPSTHNNKGRFKFFAKDDAGNWREDTSLLQDGTGCLHPRKAIVADFNKDGKPDVFVACHGLDVAPFPGELQALILSQPNGGYKTTWLPFTAFGHGASAADINNDGYPDVVLTDNTVSGQTSILLNNKDGTFTRRSDLLPASFKGKLIFTAEFIDINGDNKSDLFLAGHDWADGGPCACVTDPIVLLNDGTGSFAASNVVTLPPVAGQGVALDVVFKNSQFFVLRTSGGAGVPFYRGTVVQKVTYPGLASSVVFSSADGTMGAFAPPYAGGWTPWITHYNGNIKPDALTTGFDFSLPF